MNDVDTPEPRLVRTGLGLVVGYYEFGLPAGRPVLALHGTPASGAGFACAHTAAAARGIRLVAPDRPGIGYSDCAASTRGRTVADSVPELFAFADSLDLESFGLLGYSGGGPYALAAAHADPARVRAVALVASAGEVGGGATLRDYELADRLLSWAAVHAPPLARVALAISVEAARRVPSLALRFAEADLAPADRDVLARNFSSPRAALRLFTQAFLRSGAGVVDDYAALARPWGFAVEEVAVPVGCWHGTLDSLVPLRHSEQLVARLPQARLVRWPGEGHLAIIERGGEVLDGLLELSRRERDSPGRRDRFGADDACASGEMGAR